MSEATLAALIEFHAQWRDVLSKDVQFKLHCGALPEDGLTPAAKANAFVQAHGFQPIGFNWEMLDPEAGMDEPRSAFGTMVEALEHDLTQPSSDWLSANEARSCAGQFMAAFHASAVTILTNHLNGLWWPISGAADEWSFVAMDDDVIALWLMAR